MAKRGIFYRRYFELPLRTSLWLSNTKASGWRFWCPRPDSNRHVSRHLILSQTRLPFHHSGICAVFVSWFRKPDPHNAFGGRALPLRQHHRGTTSFRLNRRLETRVLFSSAPLRAGTPPSGANCVALWLITLQNLSVQLCVFLESLHWYEGKTNTP